jgi:drug/metabolite transporter (DMT)-like permease
MKHAVELFFGIVLLVFTLLIWLWALNQPLSNIINLCIIVGGVLWVFPIVWFGRMILDRQPTPSRAVWITTFVHYAMGIPFGAALIQAITTHQDWSDWKIPIPVEIGLLLVIITGAVCLLTVVKPCLERARCALCDCTQQEIGVRLVVCLDA